MDFHQIFSECLAQEDLELITFWGFPVTTVAMATLLRFSVLNVCGVPQPKPLHRFSPNFQDMFVPSRSRAMFWGCLVETVAMATLKFRGLKVSSKILIFSVTKILKLASSDLHKM